MPLPAMLDLADFGGTMTLKGPLQKDTSGEKRYIWVVAFNHEAYADIDLKTGLPITTGPLSKKKIVKQSPFVITKKIDYTTPKLHQAFKNDVELNPWRLDMWAIPFSGPANNYFSILLTKAKIQSIRTRKPGMWGPVAQQAAHEVEEVAFSYETIKFLAMPYLMNMVGAKAPHDTHDYPSKIEPDWKWVKAQSLVESVYKIYSDKLKKTVTEKLVAKGVLTVDGLPGEHFNK